MTTFNFTVRAMDDRGAFADRDFSIKVRNTIIDRYILGSGNGDLYTSPDGIAWKLRPGIANNSSNPYDIVNGNGRWLAVSKTNTTYLLSLDGINWSSLPLPQHAKALRPDAAQSNSPNYMPKFGFGNGTFTLQFWAYTNTNGSTGGLTLWQSVDGVTWTSAVTSYSKSQSTYPGQQAAGFLTPYDLSGSNLQYGAINNVAPVYGNGMWVMPDTLEPGRMLFSTDLKVWTQFQNIAANGNSFSSLSYFNGLWMTGTQGNNMLLTSVDGKVWQKQVLPQYQGWSIEVYYNLGKPIYGNGRIVIPINKPFGSNTNQAQSVLTSVDGTTFTVQTISAGPVTSSNAGIMLAAFHNGLFVVAINNPHFRGVYTSEDGVVWKLTADSILGGVNMSALGTINQD